MTRNVSRNEVERMPKVYKSEREKINARIKRTIAGYMTERKVRQIDLASIWGVTQQAAGYKLKTGSITLEELARANRILQIEPDDLVNMFGGRK